MRRCGLMTSTLAVGLAITHSAGSGLLLERLVVCVLWIIQLSASFQSFLILFAPRQWPWEIHTIKSSIKEGVCLKVTQSSLYPLTGSSLQTCEQHTFWLSEKRFWITQRKPRSLSLVSLLNKSSVWKSPRPDAQEVFLMPEEKGGVLTSSCQRWSP